ncbi:MBL fold metallo-hydrolase [Raoultella terrigena]|uniref:MBL fold metallo-hydrolase n=1 Tax=Raoultella terrigena TaxID=577 RepID=UPI00132F959F|nr:MBL fold metallo-hydrolase [Raoultella terrigena]
MTDNIFYIGTHGLTSWLIVSGQQAIVLDPGLEQNASLIEKNIRALGFTLQDVKLLINSHAHFDHAAGLAALEKGRHEGDNIYGNAAFPPVMVDRVLHDGDAVTLGNIRLTAVLTAGHSKGCTTWLMRSTLAGKPVNVVFPCSISVAGNTLINNRTYPGIAADYRRSFARLRGLSADIVLPNHPEVTQVMPREERVKEGDKRAFIDPGLLKRVVDAAEIKFNDALNHPAR